MTLTELIVIGSVLINVGMWFQTSRSNTKTLEKLGVELQTHKETVWPVINRHGEDIANIKGHLNINGSPMRGKGQHQ